VEPGSRKGPSTGSKDSRHLAAGAAGYPPKYRLTRECAEHAGRRSGTGAPSGLARVFEGAPSRGRVVSSFSIRAPVRRGCSAAGSAARQASHLVSDLPRSATCGMVLGRPGRTTVGLVRLTQTLRADPSPGSRRGGSSFRPIGKAGSRPTTKIPPSRISPCPRGTTG